MARRSIGEVSRRSTFLFFEFVIIVPGILRYRAALEELGISNVDHQQIDVDEVLDSPKVLAIIRELGAWAGVSRLVGDLQKANEDLVVRLEDLGEK